MRAVPVHLHTVRAMPGHFKVVDARGKTVDVGVYVSRLVDALKADPARCRTLFQAAAEDDDDLTLVVRGVPVCVDLQVTGSSHTGRQMEVDAGGGEGDVPTA
jgi:hypothetical protein